MKKIAALILSVFMIIAMLPMEAFAATLPTDEWSSYTDTTWYNDTATEFTLTTPQELAGFSQLVESGKFFLGQTVKLGGDIDISAHLWVPIGNGDRSHHQLFAGTFDGQGHKIKNIYINTTDGYQGLFGYTYSATVKNVGIDGGSITGGSSTGGIVGYADSTDIINCYNTADITSDYFNIGGIVGYFRADSNPNKKIEYCYNTGNIKTAGTDSQSIGGIAGLLSYTSVNNCYNTGNINATGTSSEQIGGIVGQCFNGEETINCCYNTGDISSNGNNSVGAISGYKGSISDCYYSGYNGGIGQTFFHVATDSTPSNASATLPFAKLAVSSIEYNKRTTATEAVNNSAAADKLGEKFSFSFVYTSDDTTKAIVEDKTIKAVELGNTSINAAITITQPEMDFITGGWSTTETKTITANISMPLTIVKATPTYTIPTELTATYGETLSDVTLPSGWVWDAPSTSVGNVGNHSFSATFTPSDITNYNTVTKNVSVAVSKATTSCEVPTGLTASYGDIISDVTLPSGWAWDDETASVGNAGTNSFSATYTPSDTDNYNTVTKVYVSVDVSKATPSYTIPTDLKATYGDTLSDVTLPSGWAWDDPSTPVGNAGTKSFSATYTPSDITNYNKVTKDVSVDVSKATPSYTIPTGLTATYGDLLSDVTLPTGWAWDVHSTPVGNAGAHNFSATFTPSDATNYNKVTKDVSVAVSKATPSYTIPTGLAATYGDTLSDVTLPTGWAWDVPSTSVGNIGTNSFSATFTPSDTTHYCYITLAIQVKVSAEVTFNTNGGSTIPSATTDSKVTKPQDPVKVWYIFSGWYKDQALTAVWDFDNDTVTENTTIYAKWSEKPGEKTATVDSKNGATVNDFDDIFGEENIVTDEDKGITAADLSNNNSVDIKVSVTDKRKDNAEKAQEILNASGNKKIGLFFEITVVKTVSNKNTNISTTKLTEVPTLLKITIPLAKELQGKQSYSVFRNHNGQIDEITTTPNVDGEYIKLSADGKSIELYVKKFSTYAIAYTDKAKASVNAQSEKQTNPKTGAELPTALLFTTGLCSTLLIKSRKTKKNR